MAYATNEERLSLINTSHGLQFVVQIETWRGESEIACDDFEHAFNTAMAWKHEHGAKHVEMRRVDQTDGSLYGGIGAL